MFSRPSIGDHLAVLRPNIRIYHHGIYVEGDQVIEMTDEGVGKISFADFKDGCPLYKVEYGVEPSTAAVVLGIFNPLGNTYPQCIKRKYNHSSTARRAQEELDSGHNWRYNLLVNNCENFTTWVVMGFKYSVQSNRATPLYDVKVYNRSRQSGDDAWDSMPI